MKKLLNAQQTRRTLICAVLQVQAQRRRLLPQFYLCLRSQAWSPQVTVSYRGSHFCCQNSTKKPLELLRILHVCMPATRKHGIRSARPSTLTTWLQGAHSGYHFICTWFCPKFHAQVPWH